MKGSGGRGSSSLAARHRWDRGLSSLGASQVVTESSNSRVCGLSPGVAGLGSGGHRRRGKRAWVAGWQNLAGEGRWGGGGGPHRRHRRGGEGPQEGGVGIVVVGRGAHIWLGEGGGLR
ncbi:hypothetical protein TIFTF001_006300 [Ficus carica]|uniref:Uncharacterized protein n=1 Tax=Ficus carica TaxID=3494 RepID=A0AA88CZK9_FICCA|nr:hypothetical protein TIFTF001_006300 [Ficus carica]